MIEFKNVSKDYPSGTHALHNINLKINNGDFVFIVGSSGAGKSTLMKVLFGLEAPDQGEIILKGQPTTIKW